MGNKIDSLIFRPPPVSYSISDPHLHLIPTPNGNSIAAYFIRHRNARFTVIFSHGNAEDIGNVFSNVVQRMSNWNCNVFMYDYPGYGLSDGVSTEESLYYCTDISYKYLTNSLNVDKNTVIAYGRSLGCTCAIYLGVKYKLLGVVLQSPFLSILRIKLSFSLPFDKFNNLERSKYLRCPALVIHGEDDELIPAQHSAELIKSIPNVYYYFIKDGGHNNLDHEFTALMDSCLIEFFNFLMLRHICRGSQGYYDEDIISIAGYNNSKNLMHRNNSRRRSQYFKGNDVCDIFGESVSGSGELAADSGIEDVHESGLSKCFLCSFC
nr:hypothetical protein MACL_00001285 [Theileria orientalis]